MKRIVGILVVLVMVLSISVSAWAFNYEKDITTANTYKGGSYVTRAASGSFWKATFNGRPSTSVASTSAYLYRSGYDRCTSITTFSYNDAKTGINYLSGQAVTGDQYKLVVKSGSVAGTYKFYFNP